MDFVKQYLVQSISYAAGNLRLNSNQMEVLALFKELILKSEHLEDDLLRMKKITELSTLAIKLYDFYCTLTRNTVDISTISDKFRQQSHFLAKDVNLLLYNANNSSFKLLFEKVRGEDKKSSEEEFKEAADEQSIPEQKSDESSFTHFEETILNPIKPADAFLNELNEIDEVPEKIDEYIETMKKNSELSKKNGFEILSGMHSIVADSLTLIKQGDIKADKETVESLKACLIVIAAVVRGKEVNISDYLNRAGNFGKKINSIKNKDVK
ncbi:MAG: hypothetical protein EHM47_16525 [Ignavibacteriales bacterium]|nr:MAG: hypothetical protein EHM47_16525 [Ignavibacteriales bacterium]